MLSKVKSSFGIMYRFCPHSNTVKPLLDSHDDIFSLILPVNKYQTPVNTIFQFLISKFYYAVNSLLYADDIH